MGCDIHSVGQVKKDGQWCTAMRDVGGDQRSYDTFAILANVRNGYGFAGCDTGDGYEPMAEPKGFPEGFKVNDDGSHVIAEGTPSGDDYSWADAKYRASRVAELAKETDVWMGDHSFSYHTLADIKKYLRLMANKTTKKRGFVTEEVFKKLDGKEAPEEYCGGVGGRDLVQMSATEYRHLKKIGELPAGKQIYVQYEWTVGYTDHTYMDKIVDDLENLAKRYDIKYNTDVRMVFGFDS